MYLQTNALNHIFVGEKSSPTGGLQVNNPSAANYIANGEILVVGEDGYTVQASPTYPTHKRIKIVQRFNDSLYFTPFINGLEVLQWKGFAYEADTYRSECVGFNGTSGDLDVSAPTNKFIWKITSEFEDTFWRMRDYTRVYAYSADTPTKIGLASAILKQGSKEWVMGSGKAIYEMLVNDAGAAIGGTTTTVTKGSERVVFTNPHGLSVGDVIRPVSGGLTKACYVVGRVVSTTIIDLTSAYTDVSATAQAAETVTVGANEVGIRVTAIDTDQFTPDLSTSRLNDFHLSLIGFGLSDRTVIRVSKRGSGSYRRVAELEHRDITQDGTYNYSIVPMDTFRKFADPGTTYDGMWIQFSGKSEGANITAATARDQAVLLYFPTGGAAMDDFRDTMDGWMASLPAAFPAVDIP